MFASRRARASGVISYPYLYLHWTASCWARKTWARASAVAYVSASPSYSTTAFSLTDKASHDAPNSTGDAVEVRNSRCVQQLILIRSKYHDDSHFVARHTGIFFWVMTTDVSWPLTETAVCPEPEIALNAYSKGEWVCEYASPRACPMIINAPTWYSRPSGEKTVRYLPNNSWACRPDSKTGEYSNLSYDVLDIVWVQDTIQSQTRDAQVSSRCHSAMSRHHKWVTLHTDPDFKITKTSTVTSTRVVFIYTDILFVHCDKRRRNIYRQLLVPNLLQWRRQCLPRHQKLCMSNFPPVFSSRLT